jgi:lipopolysaccharide/colanic/teichoic acid biosynthesis glycosyltransferase
MSARLTTTRVLDVVGATASLGLAAPVLAAAALAIRLLDGAPVLFRQQRLGRGRRPFTIVKLRTMDAGRVTPLGAVLRDLGVDELPQLYNVLRGDMALVGPRPLTAADVRRVGWDAPRFDARWLVAPGLTGPAQIAAARRCDARLSWRLDARYVRRRGLALDLRVLAASLLVPVLGKRRARLVLRHLQRKLP